MNLNPQAAAAVNDLGQRPLGVYHDHHAGANQEANMLVSIDLQHMHRSGASTWLMLCQVHR